MKKIYIVSMLFLSCLLYAQEGHKINVGLDYSFGWHYNLSQLGNPQLVVAQIGYEFDFVPFFGIEVGIGGGGFTQRVGLGGLAGENLVYKGALMSVYAAPLFYLPIKYEEKIGRAHYLFVENRFAYNRINWNFDKLENRDHPFRHQFEYAIKAGYQYPIGRLFTLKGWLGYSTFDFYRSGKSEDNEKLKTTTPIELGIGFCYILKYGKKSNL